MKNFSKILLSGAVALAMAHSASAKGTINSYITLSIVPETNVTLDAALGNTVTYDLNIGGLFNSADYSGPCVGGFNLVVDYNPAVLSLSSDSFSSLLGDGITTSFTTDSFSTPGQVDLFCASSLTATQLETAESPSFTLGTITFAATAQGSTALTWDAATSLSDENSNSLDVTGAQTGATVQAVPEPNVCGSLIIGAFGLLGWAWKTRRTFAKIG
jgi:hypothetical protein